MRRKRDDSENQSRPTESPPPTFSPTASSELFSSTTTASNNNSTSRSSASELNMPLFLSSSSTNSEPQIEAGSASLNAATRATQLAASLQNSGLLTFPSGIASPLAMGTDSTGLNPLQVFQYGADRNNASAVPTGYPQASTTNFDQSLQAVYPQQQSAGRLQGSLLGQNQYQNSNSNPLLLNPTLISGNTLSTLPNGTISTQQVPPLSILAGPPVSNPNLLNAGLRAGSIQLPYQAQVLPSNPAAAASNLNDHTLLFPNSTLLSTLQRSGNNAASVSGGPTSSASGISISSAPGISISSASGIPISSVSGVPLSSASGAPLNSASGVPLSSTSGIPISSRATTTGNIALQQQTILLSLPKDQWLLSRYQCLLRGQIEAFNALSDDVDSHARGRNRPIVLGQVGIRCVHCKFIPRHELRRGSIYFPAKIAGLYQAAQNMATGHLCDTCEQIPPHIKDELRVLRARKSAIGGGRKYWEDAAGAVGLIDTEEGIRFRQFIAQESLPSSQAATVL